MNFKNETYFKIHLKITLRSDTPLYILDFFREGLFHSDLPSVIYTYGFTFDHTPNFESGTYLLFQEVDHVYHLQIEHQFDFNNELETTRGYWLIGGLAQYAQDNEMAGYIKHMNLPVQIFSFKDKLCHWTSI